MQIALREVAYKLTAYIWAVECDFSQKGWHGNSRRVTFQREELRAPTSVLQSRSTACGWGGPVCLCHQPAVSTLSLQPARCFCLLPSPHQPLGSHHPAPACSLGLTTAAPSKVGFLG